MRRRSASIVASGLLLLWVARRMYREIGTRDRAPGSQEIQGDEGSV